jgi:hypothetical protein
MIKKEKRKREHASGVTKRGISTIYGKTILY